MLHFRAATVKSFTKHLVESEICRSKRFGGHGFVRHPGLLTSVAVIGVNLEFLGVYPAEGLSGSLTVPLGGAAVSAFDAAFILEVMLYTDMLNS